MNVEVMSFSPNDLKKLNRVVREISEEKTKIQIMSEGIKEAKKATVEDLKKNGLTSARLNTIINVYHKNNKEEYFGEISDQEALYENVFPVKQNQ